MECTTQINASELGSTRESILLSGPKDIYVFYIRQSFRITQIQLQLLIIFFFKYRLMHRMTIMNLITLKVK